MKQSEFLAQLRSIKKSLSDESDPEQRKHTVNCSTMDRALALLHQKCYRTGVVASPKCYR